MNSVILLALCSCFLVKIDCYLAPLDDGNLKQLDLGVRRELLFMIVNQINKTTIQQSAVSLGCERKINTTIASCKTCNQDLCTPQPPPTYVAIFQALGTYAYSPVLATGEFVKSIGESLKPAAKVLGAGADKFVKDLGSVSKNIGNGFKDGAEKVFKGIASGFESLGSKFNDLGSKIGSGTTDLLNGLGTGTTDLLNGIGSGFTDLSKQLGGALDNLGGGIKDLGGHLVDGVKNVGSNIGHAFGSIFGKRHAAGLKKRCTQSCPTCTQLDLKKHTKEQVLRSVCGAATIDSQQKAIKTINSLRTLYNTTITSNVITKVEYDPTSIITTGGVSFGNNFATFVLNGKTIRVKSGSPLKITDIPTSAKEIAHQIWATLY